MQRHSTSITITSSSGQAGCSATCVVVRDQGDGGGGRVVRVDAAQLARHAHEALVLQRMRVGRGHNQ